MELADLVHALLRDDLLAARQWVKDARRQHLRWETVSRPASLEGDALAAAAGLVELLAGRAGQPIPAWTTEIPPAPHDLWLDRSLASIPALREASLRFGPEALRRRRCYALPDFLAVP